MCIFLSLYTLLILISVAVAQPPPTSIGIYQLYPIAYSLFNLTSNPVTFSSTNHIISTGSTTGNNWSGHVRTLESCTGSCYFRFKTQSQSILSFRPFVPGVCDGTAVITDIGACFASTPIDPQVWDYGIYSNVSFGYNILNYKNIVVSTAESISSSNYLTVILNNGVFYYYKDLLPVLSIPSALPTSTSYSLVSEIFGIGSLTAIEFGTVSTSPTTISPTTMLVPTTVTPTIPSITSYTIPTSQMEVNPLTTPGYDVFLVIGQSNAAGSGDSFDNVVLGYPDSRIKQVTECVGSTFSIVAASDPIQNPGTCGGFNIGFATTFAKFYESSISTQRSVIIASVGLSGSGFQDGVWVATPVGVGTGVSQAVNRANYAMRLTGVGTPRFRGFLWQQGERDAGDGGVLTPSLYQQNVIKLASYLRTNIDGASQAPWLSGEMLNSWVASMGSGASGIQNVVHNVGSWLTNATNVDASGLVGTPNTPSGFNGFTVHFNNPSYRALGKRYFDAYAALASTMNPSVSILTTSSDSSSSSTNSALIAGIVSGSIIAFLLGAFLFRHYYLSADKTTFKKMKTVATANTDKYIVTNKA